jgi:hypothetical protein
MRNYVLCSPSLKVDFLPDRLHSIPTGPCSSVRLLDLPTPEYVQGQANQLAAQQNEVETLVPNDLIIINHGG